MKPRVSQIRWLKIPVADRRRVVTVRVGVTDQEEMVRWIAPGIRLGRRRGRVRGHWRRFLGRVWVKP